MTVEVTRIRLFFQRFSLVFYLGQIGIRLFGQKIIRVHVGSLNNYQAQKEYGREKRVGKLHVSAQESRPSVTAT